MRDFIDHHTAIGLLVSNGILPHIKKCNGFTFLAHGDHEIGTMFRDGARWVLKEEAVADFIDNYGGHSLVKTIDDGQDVGQPRLDLREHHIDLVRVVEARIKELQGCIEGSYNRQENLSGKDGDIIYICPIYLKTKIDHENKLRDDSEDEIERLKHFLKSVEV